MNEMYELRLQIEEIKCGLIEEDIKYVEDLIDKKRKEIDIFEIKYAEYLI